MTLISLVLVLFLIMDPFGNAKSFISYLQGISPKRQYYIIFREMLIALFAMMIFALLGEYIFSFLGVSLVTQYLASGVILFLTAIKILFPKPKEPIEQSLLIPEPFLVPLAIPMIAGPALLATVMVYAGTEPSSSAMILAIFISWSLTVAVLLSSRFLMQTIGQSGLIACERLIGMVLVLVSVQRFLEGIILFKSGLSSH